METIVYLKMAELEAGLDAIRQSPKDDGVVQMIVKRPSTDQRIILTEGELTLAAGHCARQ